MYQFIGSEPRFYSRWEDQTFYANTGDQREFTVPPTDGLWIPVESAPTVNAEWFDTTSQESAK